MMLNGCSSLSLAIWVTPLNLGTTKHTHVRQNPTHRRLCGCISMIGKSAVSRRFYKNLVSFLAVLICYLGGSCLCVIYTCVFMCVYVSARGRACIFVLFDVEGE